jgi:membrane protease YdiL (CAAX protease family)
LQGAATVYVATLAFVVVLLLNATAWAMSSRLLTIVLYHVVLAFGVCVVVPTAYCTFILHRPLADIGLAASGWPRNLLVGLALVAITTPWRLGPLSPPTGHQLMTLTGAMLLSTLFEEVFFRGFLLTAYEAAFGVVPAVLVSSFCFSLYHVGYGAEYRTVASIGKLTLVGIMFGVAFRITRSVITSFTLNLPHAIITFVAREQFFDTRTALVSVAIALFALAWIVSTSRSTSREDSGDSHPPHPACTLAR